MTKTLLLFFILIIQACSQSSSSTQKPMLWEITGNNLKTPSYLFGTFHTRDPKINTLPSRVLLALHASKRLYTEILMSNKEVQEIITFTKLHTSHPLKQRLHPKIFHHLQEYLKASPTNFTLHQFSYYKTWGIALMIANQEDISLYPHTLFMDEQLIQIAKQAHIKTMGLETPLEQLYYFDTLNKQEQELFLIDMLTQSEDTDYKDALSTWYTQGGATGFVALQERYASSTLKHQKLDKKLLSGLLYERNIRFQRRIHILLQNNPKLSYFFALGAGHLSDEKGLVSTLKRLGYKIKKLN